MNNFNTSFPESIKTAFLSMFSELFHTCMPGIIEAYDSEKRLAKVIPQIKKKYLDGSELIFPPIDNVPVMFFGAGSSGVRLPEEEYIGQTCLLVFCERSIDFWKSKGELSLPGNNRKFSISDGVAIVGLNSFNNVDEGGDDLQVFAHGNDLSIKKNGDIEINGGNTITIKQNGDIELGKNALFNLMTDKVIAKYNVHTHPIVGTATGAPVTTWLTTDATSKVSGE